jgi:hypothetical protein
MAAAVKVTDAEAKAHDAHDQMMEAERMLKMAEDTESILTIAAEIYDRCTPSSSLFTCHLSLSCIVFFFLYRLTSR